MAQTYNLDQMIITSTATNFEKNLKNELVIGKAAKADKKVRRCVWRFQKKI